MRDDRQRLRDILEAIERIERHSARGRKEFERDELIQSWILRHLQIIGEAVRSLSPELLQEHPEIPTAKITGMRNILVHDYFGIDEDVVWSAVENDLVPLKEQINAILEETGEEATG